MDEADAMSIFEVHPFDRTAEIGRRLEAVSDELWELAAAHANLGPLTDSEAPATSRRREAVLLEHPDAEVRSIAATAATCARLASEMAAQLGEADIPFL